MCSFHTPSENSSAFEHKLFAKQNPIPGFAQPVQQSARPFDQSRYPQRLPIPQQLGSLPHNQSLHEANQSTRNHRFNNRYTLARIHLGPPGVGKSSVVQKLPEIKARASRYSGIPTRPTDLRGIPTVDKGQAMVPPPFPITPTQKGYCSLMSSMQHRTCTGKPISTYPGSTDRRVSLPKGWRIIAAGNRATDRAVVFRMPSALINRFVHLDFEADFEDWRDWSISRKIHPLVLGFLSTRPELLFKMDKPDKPFPTPRSWEMVSDILDKFKSSKDCRDVILGTIGEGASMEFLGYCDNSISEEIINKIISDPEKAKLPKKLGDQYALISYLTFKIDKQNVAKAAEAIINRLSPELGVLLLRNCLQASPKFTFAKVSNHSNPSTATCFITDLPDSIVKGRIDLMLSSPSVLSCCSLPLD